MPKRKRQPKLKVEKEIIPVQVDDVIVEFDSFHSGELGDMHCPVCKKLQNAATQVTGTSEGPTPGSISVCLNCGHALMFVLRNGELALQHIPANELVTMNLSTTFWKLYELGRDRRQKRSSN